METYHVKALTDAADVIANELVTMNSHLEAIAETLSGIDNALHVQDTDNKGLADSVDEIRAMLEDRG